MKDLLLSISVIQLEVALRTVLPFLVAAVAGGIILYGFIYLGRRIERFEWQRELEKGERMGDVVKEKIRKRDARVKQLTKRIMDDEEALDQVAEKQRQITGLVGEISMIVMSEDAAKLRRRRRQA